MQHVVHQKLGARLVYRYTNVDRSYGYLLIVAVHHDSYQRANKYLYKVVNLAFSLARFSSSHFILILCLFVHLPFLGIFTYSNQFIYRIAFVRIITNAMVRTPIGFPKIMVIIMPTYWALITPNLASSCSIYTVACF